MLAQEAALEEDQDEDVDAGNPSGAALAAVVGASSQQQTWVVQLREKLEALLKMAASMKDSVPAALDEESNQTIAAKWAAFCEEVKTAIEALRLSNSPIPRSGLWILKRGLLRSFVYSKHSRTPRGAFGAIYAGSCLRRRPTSTCISKRSTKRNSKPSSTK